MGTHLSKRLMHKHYFRVFLSWKTHLLLLGSQPPDFMAFVASKLARELTVCEGDD